MARRAKRVWLIWLGLTAVLLGGYEAWVIAFDVPGETLSDAVWDWTVRYPYLPMWAGLAIGMVLAHFWWAKPRGRR